MQLMVHGHRISWVVCVIGDDDYLPKGRCLRKFRDESGMYGRSAAGAVKRLMKRRACDELK